MNLSISELDSIIIEGGISLNGVVPISASKNSSLAIIAATLLFDKPVTLLDVPNIYDIILMLNLMNDLGASIAINQPVYISNTARKSVTIDCANINTVNATYDLVRKMRASVLVLGPLVSRFGKGIISMPGGCAIGIRPINLHLDAVRKMGAEIILHDGYVEITANDGKLHGAEIEFPIISVGATENTMMAAAIAEGTTIIKNAAMEPEIVHLGEFLKSGGAQIYGLGTNTITIHGVKSLHATQYTLPADRIEAITYAIAAAATHGRILLKNVDMQIFLPVMEEFKTIGIQITQQQDGICAEAAGELSPCHVTTAPFPGFTTDVQAQITALLCTVNGISTVSENVFESRFIHIAELLRMGANIDVCGNKATIKGVKELTGANVMATDLRASVSLVIAGLMANGNTEIDRIYHLDRGYEFLENKLEACGAKIRCKRNSV